MAEELAARLSVTNRTFKRALVVDVLPEPLFAALGDILSNASIDCLPAARLDHDDLGLEQSRYDLVLAGLGLQRRNDLPGTLIQLNRALAPDGLLMAALPGEGTLEELRQSILAVEANATGNAAMRVDPFTEVRQAGALLQRAGFALPVADTEQLTLRYLSLESLLNDIRANAASNAMATAAVPLPRSVLSELEPVWRERYGSENRRFPVTVNLVYLTGWTPHESQQKPMKPGTAEHRLADFLGPADKG